MQLQDTTQQQIEAMSELDLEQVRALAGQILTSDNEGKFDNLIALCSTLFPTLDDVEFLIPKLRGLADALETVVAEARG